MSKLYNINSIKLINSIVLALSVVACSTNQISSTSFNDKSSISNKSNSFDLNKTFKVKYASGFNAMAYFLTYQDVRDAIKNKTVPDVFYHHYYTQNSEPTRVTDSTYLQTKTRLESGDFSEEAYLMANPDVKSAVDAGTIQSGYEHWYSYASTNETTRKTKQAYIDAKAAIDAGFNEKAYRMAHTDIDNLIKNNAIPNAYTHYHTWARNNETTRITNTRYVKIKNAVLEGYDENAYLLAYPDVRNQVTSGFFPKGIDHYINYGLNEGRLERAIYQDAKLAIVNDFDETRYRNTYPDVLNGINLFWFTSAFEHFRLYGRYEGRITRTEYINSKGKLGNEFIVNSYTTETQRNTKIATDNNNNFIISWYGPGTEDTDNGIFIQRYNSAGVKQGSNFIVNTYTTGNQANPSIATDNNNNFIISWSGPGTGDTGSGIFAQRYNSAGNPQGSNLLVNEYTTGSQGTPSIATDNNNNFIISWAGPGTGDTGSGIFAQRYNSAGVKQGTEFLVNEYTTGLQGTPSIATDNNNNFIISWAGPGTGDTGSGIFAQRYNSAGVKQGTEFLVNEYTTGFQSNPSIAADNNGNFIISWYGPGTGDTGTGIFAQRFNSAGTPQGSNFLVNTYTTGSQGTPSIATDNNNNFIISWTGTGTGDNVFGIFAQRYNSNGVKQGAEFLVNSYTTGLQGFPSIATDNNGNFIISWYGNGTEETTSYGIFAQRYSSQ